MPAQKTDLNRCIPHGYTDVIPGFARRYLQLSANTAQIHWHSCMTTFADDRGIALIGSLHPETRRAVACRHRDENPHQAPHDLDVVHNKLIVKRHGHIRLEFSCLVDLPYAYF